MVEVGEEVSKFLVGVVERRVEEGCEEEVSPVDRIVSLEQAGEALRGLVHLVRARGEGEGVQEAALRLLAKEQLPLDIRNNAGILYVMMRKVEGEWEALEAPLVTESSEYSSGSLLAMVHGVLSTYTREEVEQGEVGRRLLTSLLSCYLRVAGSGEQGTAIVLGHSRGVLHWSTKFLGFSCSTGGCGEVAAVLGAAWEYVWRHLEHPVDSVRHNSRSAMANMVQGLVAGGRGEEVEALLTTALQLPADSRARLVSLATLVKHNPAIVLPLCPTLQADTLTLAGQQALSSHVVELYQQILTAQLRLQPEAWFQATVQPLLQLYAGAEGGAALVAGTLLRAAVKLSPSVISRLVGEQEGEVRLGLACLRMAREACQPWHFPTHAALVAEALRHREVEVRLQGLQLLVESHSSVEQLTQAELDFLLPFIRLHLALQSPAAQQQFIVLAKKLVVRMVDGAAALTKKMTQRKFEGEKEAMGEVVAMYCTWLRCLLRSLLTQLFPGANHPRRSSCLQLLLCLASTPGLAAPRHGIDLSTEVTAEAAATLLTCLADSYDTNKSLALSILRLLPPSLLNLHLPDKVSSLLTSLTTLASSSKPPDTLSAMSQARFLLSAPALPWVLADRLGLVTCRPTEPKLLTVVVLQQQLVKQVEGAEERLLDAAVDGPMYGTVAVIRAVYEELEQEEYSEEWTTVTTELLATCSRVWEAVRAVVASDSPEGHLPMDAGSDGAARLHKVVKGSLGARGKGRRQEGKGGNLYTAVSLLEVKPVFPDEVAEELVEELVGEALGVEPSVDAITELGPEIMELQFGDKKSEEVGDGEEMVEATEAGHTKAREVSSQMVLLCAWRSVKEVALLLGHLCSTYSSSRLVNLVTKDQVLNISSFLLSLLLETKHRGAFEQAYVAFCSVVSTLWRSPAPELHGHPAALLAELLLDIEDGERRSLCATRRSAGVPFIVQAVVVGEGGGSDGGPTLRATMARLLGLARGEHQEARVHAMNILRVLYRESKLGDAVTTFLEDGVRVAITGFKAANWSERTAATLLFSALMTRIFGVKRSKEVVSTKNCLTGKVFFQRHPSLHPFLLEQFEEVKEEAAGLQLHSALYPVLLLLARLYPSPTETVSNPFPLSSFLPHVTRAAASSLLYTRRLAAAALVSLVPAEGQVGHAASLLGRLGGGGLPPQNHLHGALLQVGRLVGRAGNLDPLAAPLLALAEPLLATNPCYLTQAAYITLCCRLLPTWQETKVDTGYLEGLLAGILRQEGKQVQVWRPLLLRGAATLVVRAGLGRGEVEVAVELLTHPEQEVREEVLGLLQGESKVLEKVWEKVQARLVEEKHPGCVEMLLRLYCSAPSPLPSTTLPLLLTMVEGTETEEVRSSCLTLVSRALSPSSPHLLPFASLLHTCLAPEHGARVRVAGARCLVTLAPLLTSSPNEEDRVAWVLLWTAVIKLLQQDEQEVRVGVSAVHHAMSGEWVAEEVAGPRLVERLVATVGKVWPSATLFALLAAVTTAMLDTVGEEVDTEVDRAFDRNEVNCYEEAVGLGLDLLPHLTSFLRRLSPRLQASALSEHLPSSLLTPLLPDLPAAVTVYSVEQLVEYLATRPAATLSPTEAAVTAMLLAAVTCPATDKLHISSNVVGVDGSYFMAQVGGSSAPDACSRWSGRLGGAASKAPEYL